MKCDNKSIQTKREEKEKKADMMMSKTASYKERGWLEAYTAKIEHLNCWFSRNSKMCDRTAMPSQIAQPAHRTKYKEQITQVAAPASVNVQQ